MTRPLTPLQIATQGVLDAIRYAEETFDRPTLEVFLWVIIRRVAVAATRFDHGPYEEPAA